jgi:hypothetical protein
MVAAIVWLLLRWRSSERRSALMERALAIAGLRAASGGSEGSSLPSDLSKLEDAKVMGSGGSAMEEHGKAMYLDPRGHSSTISVIVAPKGTSFTDSWRAASGTGLTPLNVVNPMRFAAAQQQQLMLAALGAGDEKISPTPSSQQSSSPMHTPGMRHEESDLSRIPAWNIGVWL